MLLHVVLGDGSLGDVELLHLHRLASLAVLLRRPPALVDVEHRQIIQQLIYYKQLYGLS